MDEGDPSKAIRPLLVDLPQRQNLHENTWKPLEFKRNIFIRLMLVLNISYTKEFDEIHMTFVLDIFTRR